MALHQLHIKLAVVLAKFKDFDACGLLSIIWSFGQGMHLNFGTLAVSVAAHCMIA